jgi:mRNA-degrading endonuclease RelE of RelBE toxin-antitoxin system
METKTTQNTIEIHPSVLAGLDVLSPEEKERVLNAIASLENFSPEQPMTPNIQKFRPEQPFYLLKVDTSLRLIFEINHRDEIEIQDLVRQETLEFMSHLTH